MPRNFQVRLTYMKHEDNQHQKTQMLTLATVQSWLDHQPFQKVVL